MDSAGNLWRWSLMDSGSNFTRLAFSTVSKLSSRLRDQTRDWIKRPLETQEMRSRLCCWCVGKCWAGVVLFGNNIENRQSASLWWKDLQIITTINWGYLRHEELEQNCRTNKWHHYRLRYILIVYLNEHLWSINYHCVIKPLRWTNPPILAGSIKATFSWIRYKFFSSCPRLWEINF